MKVLALIGLLVATVTGCEVIVGKCPDVRVVQNFEVASYLGVWYEYAKYYQVFATGSCITANYSLNTNGSVKVVNQQIEATGNISSLEGYAIFAGESDEAKLIVRFPVTPVAAPYWVLATDYTTYAVVFSCTDVVGVVSERWLAENLHDALQSEDPASRLSEYRDMWVDLSHMMQQLGKAYSGMYALYCLLILLTTIVATYGCVTEILDHGLSFKELGLFLIAFYCITLLFIICNEAHSTSRKMGPAFRERLLNVNLAAVDDRTVQEVNMFLTAIDKNPPIMNLNGYANINRKLISSTVTSAATYLVMLMQFRLTLQRNAAIAAKKANATALLMQIVHGNASNSTRT